MRNQTFVGYIFVLVTLFSCSDTPQQIVPLETAGNSSGETGIFNNTPSSATASAESTTHTVTVQEVLQASKYSYLKVKEAGDTYWLATLKDDFIEGMDYIYMDRLLKRDFESAEFNRIFDKIYLVSRIAPIGESGRKKVSKPQEVVQRDTKNLKQIEGVTSLSDLIENPEKFQNTVVKVHGEVVKVNLNIMNRHWIHLKDGSADDYDFVLTSQTSIPVGHTMVFEGVITLKKDFGAGYYYDIIMEDAKSIQ